MKALQFLIVVIVICFEAIAQPNQSLKMEAEDANAREIPMLPRPIIEPITGLFLENSDIRSVLDLYGHFAGRTVLWPYAIGKHQFTFSNSSTNRAELARAIEMALEKASSPSHDGDKFVMVVPQSWIGIIKPNSPQSMHSTLRLIKTR
jgi:hypothetical protein